MTSNKNLRACLVAIVIFGSVISLFESEFVTNTTTEDSATGQTLISATQPVNQVNTYREELNSYIAFTPVDEELLQPLLLLFFLVVKMAVLMSCCILLLMLVCSKPWRRVCHSKGLMMPFKNHKSAETREPFDNSRLPKSFKKSMSHSDPV